MSHILTNGDRIFLQQFNFRHFFAGNPDRYLYGGHFETLTVSILSILLSFFICLFLRILMFYRVHVYYLKFYILPIQISVKCQSYMLHTFTYCINMGETAKLPFALETLCEINCMICIHFLLLCEQCPWTNVALILNHSSRCRNRLG